MKEMGQYKRGSWKRGHAALFFVLSAPLIITVLALCVDVSLRRCIGSELQAAADAAALAGAQSLAEAAGSADISVAAAQAYNIATANKTTLGQIAPGITVEIGLWNTDTRTFGPAGNTKPDAVRITAVRSATAGNAIPSVLAQLFDTGNKVTTRVAVARVEKIPDYALIGGDRFTAKGVLVVTGAPYATNAGSIASNGDVTLNLLGLIGVTLMDGEISTRGTVNAPAIGVLTKIDGGIKKPEEPFTLPPISIAIVANTNDNANLGTMLSGSGNFNVSVVGDVPAGTYYVQNMNVLTGALVRFTGPVTIYVANDVNVLGAVQVFQNNPSNLKIRVAGTGNVNIAANVAMTADIYAPKCAATVAVGLGYSGRLIAKTVDVIGTGLFFLRPNLPQPELGRSRVSVVR